MFQIGELSKHTDGPEKTIRHYEEIGLRRPARRGTNWQPIYDEAAGSGGCSDAGVCLSLDSGWSQPCREREFKSSEKHWFRVLTFRWREAVAYTAMTR